MLVGVGLLAVIAGETRVVRIAGWSAAVLGIVNTPVMLPAFALVVVGLAIAKRSLWPLAAIPVAIALALIDLRLHTGGFTSPYANDHGATTVLPFSGRPGFSYPAFFGILGIVFSLGKGLLFYAPGLFLPVRNRLAASLPLSKTRLVWIAVVVGMVAIYCRWWAWYGGIFYGPRFFLFASLPASLAIAARLCTGARSLTGVALSIAALALSLWVGFTSSMGVSVPSICAEDNYALEHLCLCTHPSSAHSGAHFIQWPGPPRNSSLRTALTGRLLGWRSPLGCCTPSPSLVEPSRHLHDFRHAKPW